MVCVYLQNTTTFTLERDEVGEVVMEDGRSRCPFNPVYKSTAIIVGTQTVFKHVTLRVLQCVASFLMDSLLSPKLYCFDVTVSLWFCNELSCAC